MVTAFKDSEQQVPDQVRKFFSLKTGPCKNRLVGTNLKLGSTIDAFIRTAGLLDFSTLNSSPVFQYSSFHLSATQAKCYSSYNYVDGWGVEYVEHVEYVECVG